MAVPLVRLQATAEEARRHAVPVHLDGARLFYAAAALDVEPSAMAAAADSVVFSLCKGIGAPAGAILAGSAAFIATARKILFALGGTLRMPGVIAAPGLLALEKGRASLNRDFASAQRLAQAMAGFGIRAADVPTNVVLFDPSPFGLSAKQFADLALEGGVQVILLGENLVRLTAHSGLSNVDLVTAEKVLSAIVQRYSRERAG